MSYVPIDQEANTQGPTGQTSNIPGQTSGAGSTAPPPQSGGSAGGGTAAGAPVGASNGSPTQFGSSASKLSDYLTANAPQIQNQANTVVGGLNQQYGQVSGDITNAANQFGQQISGGYTPGNQDVVNQAAANPTQFASNPANITAFQKQLNDTYTGPTAFEGSTPYSNIQNEVGTAVQDAGLLNTPAGLQNYLGKTGGGNQTQASNTLDQLLLSGNPAASQEIQQAAGQFGQLTPQLASDTASLDAAAQAAAPAAQAAAQYAQSQINPVATNFGNTLNNQLMAAQGNTSAYNASIPSYQAEMQALNSIANQWNGATASAPNYSSQAAQFTNPVASLATPQPITQPLTLANSATAPQYAESNALAQLLGSGYNAPLNQANIGQAGTAPAIPGTLQSLTPDAQQIANDLLSSYNQTFTNYQPISQGSPSGAGAFNQMMNQYYNNDLIPLEQQLGQYGVTNPVPGQ
jgi:hypothetical protein